MKSYDKTVSFKPRVIKENYTTSNMFLNEWMWSSHFLTLLKQQTSKKKKKKSSLNENSKPAPCDTGAVLHQKVSESSLQELLKNFH